MMTQHTIGRIRGRLGSMITRDDIARMSEASQKYRKGKHYVAVRFLDRVHYLDDSTGDSIVCIVTDGNVITAMLSKRTQRWRDGGYRVYLGA